MHRNLVPEWMWAYDQIDAALELAFGRGAVGKFWRNHTMQQYLCDRDMPFKRYIEITRQLRPVIIGTTGNVSLFCCGKFQSHC